MTTVEALPFASSARANTMLAPKRLMESHNGLGSDLQGFDEDLRPEESLVSRVDGGETTFDTDREIGPHCFKNGLLFNRLRLQISLIFTSSPTDKPCQRSW